MPTDALDQFKKEVFDRLWVLSGSCFAMAIAVAIAWTTDHVTLTTAVEQIRTNTTELRDLKIEMVKHEVREGDRSNG